MKKDINLNTINRVTLIDQTTDGLGRAFEKWGISVRLDVQDKNQTLKIFVTNVNSADKTLPVKVSVEE